MVLAVCQDLSLSIISGHFYNKKNDESRDDHVVVPANEDRIC